MSRYRLPTPRTETVTSSPPPRSSPGYGWSGTSTAGPRFPRARRRH